MSEADQAQHDCKHIDTANWQSGDEQTVLWSQTTGMAKTPAEWVGLYLQPQLTSSVPKEIVTLLEVARGAMIYGWFFYPLVTLGAEQCWRVLQAGVRLRCQQLGIQTKRKDRGGREWNTSFFENVSALLGSNLVTELDKPRWDAVRRLRNSTSHPDRQMILDPGQGRQVLGMAVEVLNDLFQ